MIITFGVAHEFDKHGRKAVQKTKANIESAKDYLEHRKAEQPKEAAKKAYKEKATETAIDVQKIEDNTAYSRQVTTPISQQSLPEESPQPSFQESMQQLDI